MANETWKFVQAKSKQAMKQVLGIRDEKARMKKAVSYTHLTLPTIYSV